MNCDGWGRNICEIIKAELVCWGNSFMITFLAQIVDHLPLRLQFVVAVVLDEAGPALLHCRVFRLRLPCAVLRVSGEDGAFVGRDWQVEVVARRLWLAPGPLR